jgi:hypothetical protein
MKCRGSYYIMNYEYTSKGLLPYEIDVPIDDGR